ncbi:MAG: Gfo/Idh/MocA family oxidoreductase [Epsilonproteobacteria bacterium]|nr:Gfo/Idh/MocA family oxidoreductase [Campylobacterota bacterium]
MKALIIGYGSIGQRHHDVLSSMEIFEAIHIVTSQILDDITTFKTLEDVTNIDTYDYYVIASETYKHFDQLIYLDRHVNQKIILCEKPLFDRYQEITIENNHVYIGYVLRFHPIFTSIRTLLNEETPILISIKTGSYLPTWRPQRDYRTLYSAFSEQGGGVLLDLSHEIDYAQWLFGPLRLLNSYQGKISDLEIDSDDITVITAQGNHNTLITLSLDYISKIPMREMSIHTNNQSIHADMINNTLKIGTKEGEVQTIALEPFERNDLFIQMHRSALGDKENLCTLHEGLNVMKTISYVQEHNHG